MMSPFDYWNLRNIMIEPGYPNRIFASEDIPFNSSYDLIGTNKNHEAIEYATVYKDDGTESSSYNYNNSHTKHLLIDAFTTGQVFKLKPNAGYTVNVKRNFYDNGWQEESFAVTPSNTLELPIDSENHLRLEFVSVTKDEEAETETEEPESEPESDEIVDTEPDQTDSGFGVTTQTHTYQPTTADEPESESTPIVPLVVLGGLILIAFSSRHLWMSGN
jgi:hypothetical protein